MRLGWAESAVPAPGPLAYKDVVVNFEGTPAPSHVIEASGGEVYWKLDAGELALGDVRIGEGRTDVVRVSVPPWTTGEPFVFRVTARASDAKGAPQTFRAAVLSADGLALSGVIHDHPFFGPLNVYQWVELIAAHEMRHVAQMREAAAQLMARV